MKLFQNFSSKKGMESQLLIIILILAGAIVIFLFLTKFITKVNSDSVAETCRLSVLAQSATNINPLPVGKQSPLNVDCAKRYIDFYNTKVEMGLSPEDTKPMSIDYEGKKTTQFSQLSETIVYEVVAEELRICKYEFGDGKVDIFPNDKGWISGSNLCFICSEINFKSSVQQQNFPNLLEFTKKTTFSTDGKNYYDYLTEKTFYSNPMWDQTTYPSNNPISNLNLDKSKQYLIYVVKSDTPIIPVPGPAVKYISLRIVPADAINNYCNNQPT